MKTIAITSPFIVMILSAVLGCQQPTTPPVAVPPDQPPPVVVAPPATPAPPTPDDPTGDKLEAWEENMLKLHNAMREYDLTINKSLRLAAQRHSGWMAKNESMDHDEPFASTRTFWDRATLAGYTGRGGGENIAAGQRSSTEVFQAWMNSSGHRRNIQAAAYRDVGFGCEQGKSGRLYWCVVFGIPGGATRTLEATIYNAPPGLDLDKVDE